MDKKTLVIITDSFPFGQGETFLADELIYLSYEFEHIYLIPSFISKNSIAREIPLNCTIESFFADRIQLFCAPKALLKKGLRLNLLWNELTNTQVLWFIKNFKAINVLATKAIFEAGILGSWIQNRVKEPYLLYSYWFSEPAAACAVLKQRKVVSLWISGTHGYDLYDERHPLKKQPFRSFKIKYCNLLFTACLRAKEYILENSSSKFQSKIASRYLGITIPNQIVKQNTTSFTIVSCSNVIPLKRMNLIVDVLQKITFPIKWIHIGDGLLMNELKSKIDSLPGNVVVQLLGFIEKNQIPQIYFKENPSLFVHFSETEGGAPVAIMDALSCGIPILGCDAGGVSEIITPDIGKLLVIDFKIDEAVDFITLVRDNKLVFSGTKIQEYCRQKFNAEDNYTKFAKKLSEE